MTKTIDTNRVIVMKFGGTSVGNADRINQLIEIVRSRAEKTPVVIVVSAMSGITNLLEEACTRAADKNEAYHSTLDTIIRRHEECIGSFPFSASMSSELINQIRDPLNRLGIICRGLSLVGDLTMKTKAHIMSFGEILSSKIVRAALESAGLNGEYIDSRDVIMTDNEFLSAHVDFEETNKRIRESINPSKRIYIAPGYISRSDTGESTTLGRGGSDYTAAIFAGALDASRLEIWTDVNGMLSADPRLVRDTITIPTMSYEEAMELSYFGAKVIYPPTIQPALTRQIPIAILNSFHPDHPGTTISNTPDKGSHFVKGLTCIQDIVLVTLSGSGMIGVPGVAQRLFQALSEANINILFITQSSSEHTICFAINRKDDVAAKKAMEKAYEFEINLRKIDPIDMEYDLALVAVVGDGMRERAGIAGKLFSLLGENGINIRAIAQGSTERNISFVINQHNATKTLNVLHEGFFLSKYKTVHLYLMGTGNVGATLIKQIAIGQKAFKEAGSLDLKVCGIANSKLMYLDPLGIDLEDWETQLNDHGKNLSLFELKDQIKNFNLRNSILVDVTASEQVSKIYDDLLASSVHVVTANKIAASSSYLAYKKLKELSAQHNVKFLNETNVGAGLPVIKTIRDLVLTGDRIHRIQAVLSGSLNYIFDRIGSDGCLFSVAVTEAREKGYTEPNPALDLSGKDVMRKILILTREAGMKLEMEDIKNKPFLPAGTLDTDNWNDLLANLKKLDAKFEIERIALAASNKRWRYMASLEDGIVSTGLEIIDSTHPAYHLKGTDNIILMWTDRYANRPMVIAGAGAGPEVTASGVLADVISISNV
ncbi:MAG TPA: bifunctional aspartate kinase/homoserine dehydrogenase I [Saprospiraceae bacterium]|nr:bifunctional aspartate kinase/homoserine dehydrogenase I [Saprospiraceae bacterium]